VAPSASWSDVRLILLIFVATTALLWIVAYGASTVFPENDVETWHYTPFRPLDVWARWDSALYVDIARWGYERAEDRPDYTPWFPLYAYLIRYLSPRPRYDYPVGHIISLISFLLLLFVLFDVVAEKLGKDVARLSVLYLSIFPSALFFRAVYAESLFTLLVLLSYRAFLSERYLRCGIYGGLAAMTRVPGIMLLPAFGATLVWETVRGQKRLRPSMLFVGVIASGLAAVMIIQWRAVGDPLAFLHAAALPDLERTIMPPGQSLVEDLKRMMTEWNFAKGYIEFNLVLDNVAAVLAVVGAFYFFRRYGFLAGALALCLLLPPLMSGRTIGMIRYILPIFFYPVLLAEIGSSRPWFHTFWVFASTLFLAFYTICFACWYWTA
jgi:hypothetical protein